MNSILQLTRRSRKQFRLKEFSNFSISCLLLKMRTNEKRQLTCSAMLKIFQAFVNQRKNCCKNILTT